MVGLLRQHPLGLSYMENIITITILLSLYYVGIQYSLVLYYTVSTTTQGNTIRQNILSSSSLHVFPS